MGVFHLVAVLSFSESVFWTGLKLANWGTSEKKWCTSFVARGVVEGKRG